MDIPPILLHTLSGPIQIHHRCSKDDETYRRNVHTKRIYFHWSRRL